MSPALFLIFIQLADFSSLTGKDLINFLFILIWQTSYFLFLLLRSYVNKKPNTPENGSLWYWPVVVRPRMGEVFGVRPRPLRPPGFRELEKTRTPKIQHLNGHVQWWNPVAPKARKFISIGWKRLECKKKFTIQFTWSVLQVRRTHPTTWWKDLKLSSQRQRN